MSSDLRSLRARSRAGRRAAIAVVVGGVLAGCAAHLQDPERFEAALDGGGSSSASSSACGDVPTILAMHCASAGCHSTASMTQGLDLQSPNLFGRLAGQSAVGGPGVIIDPQGDPNQSVLYLKLMSPPPFGSQMPLTGAKLDEATIACVASWIMSEGGGTAKGSDATAAASDTGTAGPDSASSTPPDASMTADGTTPPPADSGASHDSGTTHHDAGAVHDSGSPPPPADAATPVDASTGDATAPGDAAQE